MKPLLFILACCGWLMPCCQTNMISASELKEIYSEESSFAYSLPYEKGKSYLLVQAYQSKILSHKDAFALDFKMKKGAKICAARAGIVVAVKEDSRKGGLKIKYLSEGNHVIIRHDDSTYGNYWHLKHNGALVKIGDTVQQGQTIGLAGKTGYAAFAHLHFEVTTKLTPGYNQIPTQFATNKGRRYLRPLHWYKCI